MKTNPLKGANQIFINTTPHPCGAIVPQGGGTSPWILGRSSISAGAAPLTTFSPSTSASRLRLPPPRQPSSEAPPSLQFASLHFLDALLNHRHKCKHKLARLAGLAFPPEGANFRPFISRRKGGRRKAGLGQ